MYFKLILVLAAVASVAHAEKVLAVVPCVKGSYGTVDVKEVRVTPCAEASRRKPCVLPKGTNVTIEIDFTPTVTADRIVSRALWAARRLELPLPNMNTNACELLQCPIQANVPQTYRYILPISRVFPSRSYVVKWRMNDEDGFNLCLQFAIAITN